MQRRNKPFLLVFFTLLLLVFWPQESQAATPQISAQAAVLIDARNGQILYEKKAHQPLPPASCGKIITAITAMEMADSDQFCWISKNVEKVGEASIDLREGDVYTLEELLKGALIKSGNDACYAIGENLAGSEPFFVYWLNLKSLAIGAFSANLQNTNGLPAENHVISAYDLALAARYAMRNDLFASIVRSKFAQIGSQSTARSLKNTNKLLWQDEAITGIKTGTTDAAGACLVASWEQSGRQLIAVVFHSPDRYAESLKLLRYGADETLFFDLAKKGEIIAAVHVKKGHKELLPLVSASDIYYCYKKEDRDGLHIQWQIKDKLSAPVEKNELVGQVMILDKANNILAKSDLLAAERIEKKGFF
ncbi:MAG: D-alanyl-D-alanine carboxypeptidase family protein [Bacillota bacterium]|jgi:D-alanyl-D-alanine carboxypeptidase (penicillin-binding protein 5/6)